MIIDTSPDRPRVLGEVDLFSAQVLVHERAIYMHESVQYYVDRLEWGERKAYVHRIDVGPLHLRQPGGHPEAARRLRRGAGAGRAAGPRRGDGRQPRHALQEAEVRDGRERRLGADRPAGARAPDDRLLADRRGRGRWLAAERARHRADGRRAGDPDGGRRPPDGRPARPRPRDPGPLAPSRGADDLPVRGGARRDRAEPTPVGPPRGAGRRRRGSDRAAATATAAARRAPGRGSSRTSTPGRSPSGCSDG